ncbi:MAG: hypothetical protein COA59_08650 [Colwellia sp.]|nr:MAG: hypothetical protein COA59_08650 [Colwellia sp.]
MPNQAIKPQAMLTEQSNTPSTTITKPLRWQLKITRFGLSWLLTSIIFFILAANYSNNLLLFIALLLLAVLINVPWITWLNIRKLNIQTVDVKPIYAQQKGAINIQVVNTLAKFTPGVSVSIKGYAFNNTPETPLPLSQYALNNTSVAINPLARGCFALNKIQLSCNYPLGLWQWHKRSTSKARLWVYPAPQGKLALPKPKAKQGTYLKREQGDFSHVRTYQRGDSLNHIAWKQMARTGEVMTKEFDGGEGLRQTVLSYQNIKHGDIESRLSQLCRWILDSHKKQLKYALELPNKTIAAGQGEAHKNLCLQALAQFGLTLPPTELPQQINE